MAAVLAEDVRVAYPQVPLWSESRDLFVQASREHALPGEYRFVPTSANLQPAVAIYCKQPDDDAFHIVALEVLRVVEGKVVEIVDFHTPGLYAAFGLDPTL